MDEQLHRQQATCYMATCYMLHHTHTHSLHACMRQVSVRCLHSQLACFAWQTKTFATRFGCCSCCCCHIDTSLQVCLAIVLTVPLPLLLTFCCSFRLRRKISSSCHNVTQLHLQLETSVPSESATRARASGISLSQLATNNSFGKVDKEFMKYIKQQQREKQTTTR